MKKSITLNDVDNAIDSLIQSSWESTDFKNIWISNPTKVIENHLDQKLNFNSKIVVEDQSDINTIYLNIPRNTPTDDLILNDEDLELIVGGWNPIRALGRQAKRVYNAIVSQDFDVQYGSTGVISAF